jgi:HK97 family phage portal protein
VARVIIAPDGRARALEAAKSFPLEGAGIDRSFGPTGGSIPLLSRDFPSASYELIYRRQPWIYITVNKISSAVARLPLKSFRYLDLDERDRERVKDHPLPRLLRTPYPRGSAFELKRAFLGSVLVHGHGLLAKYREGRDAEPSELWVVPWRHIRVVAGTSGAPAAYIFRGQGGDIELDPDDLIHVSTLDGVSPLEPLRLTLALEDAAVRWQAGYFANGARPSGVFSTKGTLEKNSIRRLRAELDALYGGVDNAGRFAIFDQGLEWNAITASAVDTALIDSRKLNREEAAAVYDIPQPMIGILDKATYSNVSEQHKMLYQDTLGPWLALLEQAFMAQLVDPEPAFGGLFLEFDLNEVLRSDLQARADAYTKLVAAGVYKPDELRRLENLPPEGGNAERLYIAVNLQPVNPEPGDEEPAPPDPGGAPPADEAAPAARSTVGIPPIAAEPAGGPYPPMPEAAPVFVPTNGNGAKRYAAENMEGE